MRHSQVSFVLLRPVTVRAWRRAHTCSRRVGGGLLENQLHVRWIIRLVRRDGRRERRERRRQEGLPSCAEPILKPGRPGCMQRLTRRDIAERKAAYISIQWTTNIACIYDLREARRNFFRIPDEFAVFHERGNAKIWSCSERSMPSERNLI